MLVGVLTIGTFSRRTGLSVRALRLYDELGVLRPDSLDPRTGYRLYSPSQVRAARMIALLRAAEMPLRDIAVVLEQADRASAHRLIDSHAAELEAPPVGGARSVGFGSPLPRRGGAQRDVQ